MINSKENRKILAERIIESMDMDSLLEFAQETLEEKFLNNDELFQNQWKDEFLKLSE